MKCPKCGSENVFYNTSYDGKDYYICGNCKTHYSLPTVAVSKTEPSTAEMLLWLVENGWLIGKNNKYQTTILTPNKFSVGISVDESNTLADVITTSYLLAKQEEQND